MTFADLVESLEPRERTLTVLDRTEPDPVFDLLKGVFGGPAVTVGEADTDGDGPIEDAVVLRKDGEVAAVSPFSDIRDTVLLINSDIYTTGARPIDAIDTPDVIAHLDDTPLFVEGYPSVKKQKMLLIEISRYIEHRAWCVGDGELHSGFQRLSRIDDESGTRQVYERLADTDLEVHAYGVPDWDPDIDVVPHGDRSDDLRYAWFVAFDPPRDDRRKVALVAYKPDPPANDWHAFWTHDPERVDEVIEYATDRYPATPALARN